GVDTRGMPLCPAMPHYDGEFMDAGASDPIFTHASFMTDLEADAIVAYLRSLPAVSRQIPASVCPPIEPPPAFDLATQDQSVIDASAPDLASSDGGADLAEPVDGGANG